jgi:hypothetical protein
MPYRPHKRKGPFLTLIATAWCVAALPLPPLRADDAGSAVSASAPQPSATVRLINRMLASGAISKQDAAQLIAQANADAADAQVQVAEAQLAAAKAQAAVARARAAAAVLQSVLSGGQGAPRALAQLPAPAVTDTPAPQPPAPAALPEAAAALPQPAPASFTTPAATAQAPVAAQPAAAPEGAPAASQLQASPAPDSGGDHALRVSDVLGETTPVPNVQGTSAPVPLADAGGPPASAADTSNERIVYNPQGPAPAPADLPAPTAAPQTLVQDRPAVTVPAAPRSTGDTPPADGTVHVAYVPEAVREQITEEVKDEVLDEARKEGWGAKVPGWVTKFDLYGDIRIRIEEIINHSTNADDGSFPNFNAINTGSPFDTAGNVNYPQYNVNQNRQRERLRARMGAAIDLQDGFTVGLRLATGNDNNPVTENQTFGAAGGAQGGDFAKYSVWLDRAYLKYMSGGDTANDFSVTLGRFENPFFATNLLWANDLGFDGALLRLPLRVHWDDQVVDSVKPFIVAGVFPVFNTDLNFATDQSVKYSSYDKWLGAVQAGSTWKVGSNFDLKTAVAMYYYVNMQGELSAPFTPLTSSDNGSTDASRPSFAQNGNTYMELRDIVPGPTNDNGTIDQWQYYGLATPFHDLALTQEIDFNAFEPFRVSLVGEFVDNLAFNRQAIQAIAVNNLGTAPSSGTAPYVGGNEGWFVNLKVGDAVFSAPGNWWASVGYRHVESDSVVDAFTDADFGGELTGTNLKGFTIEAAVAVAKDIWFEAHWFSATAIAGPSFKNDTLQFDVNAKF